MDVVAAFLAGLDVLPTVLLGRNPLPSPVRISTAVEHRTMPPLLTGMGTKSRNRGWHFLDSVPVGGCKGQARRRTFALGSKRQGITAAAIYTAEARFPRAKVCQKTQKHYDRLSFDVPAGCLSEITLTWCQRSRRFRSPEITSFTHRSS